MRKRDYLYGVLAGFFLIAFWFVTGYISMAGPNSIILMILYPLISATITARFLRYDCGQQMRLKLTLFILSALFFFLLTRHLRIWVKLFFILYPEYGRLSAGGSFGLLVFSFIYLLVNCIVILSSIPSAQSQEKKESNQ